MPLRPLFICVALALGLSGCASLTPQQCMTGNWADIGYHDGANGRAPDYINAHREACAELGVTPDPAAWAAGRTAGLVRYCTPDNAYREGRDGDRFNQVCPVAQQSQLNRAHDWGLQYYEYQVEINDAESEIRQLMTMISTILANPAPTPEELEQIPILQNRIRRLEREIRRTELRQRRYARLPY